MSINEKEQKMNKAQFKKADKVVKDSLEEVGELIQTLLSKQDDEYKIFVLEGAMHSIIHILEQHTPSGLYSTQFIVGVLNDTLLAQIHLDVDEEMSDERDESKVLH